MLHWRVTQADGTERPNEEVDDLKVSAVSTDVTEPTDPYDLPAYSGVYTVHPECTQGRPGGYNDGDQY
jgi:tyrosinase